MDQESTRQEHDVDAGNEEIRTETPTTTAEDSTLFNPVRRTSQVTRICNLSLASFARVDSHTQLPAHRRTEEEKDPYEVSWEENGHMDPRRRLSKGRKWLITFIIAGSSICVTNTSSLYTSTYIQVTSEFQISRIVATLGLSLYVFGLGLAPMILSPLSEFYGRRPVYVISFTSFLIWLVPCAVAQNTATLLVCRFLDGLSGSAFLSVAGGTIRDMFTNDELSTPMMIYSASPFLGPEIGPLIGGFINQFTTWRWSFYVLIIWAGAQLVMIVLLVPETYHPVLLRKRAQQLRKETGNSSLIAPIEKLDRSLAMTVMWSCIRPFQLLLFEPMCLNLCILSSILLGVLYLFFGAFPLVFQNNHGFELWQTGVSFMGLMVGMIIGIFSDPIWARNHRRLVQKLQAQNGRADASEPEFRLPPTILGSMLVPVSLLGFGWTTFSRVHWIAPIAFSGLFGVGIILVYSGIFTFLVDCYPVYAASALAANSFARSSFAAAFPLFGNQMFNTLGYQWASSLLAFLSLAMAPFPYIFFKYGKRLRGRSRYAFS